MAGYSFGGSSNASGGAATGSGYSYATLSSSVDPPLFENRSYRSHTLSGLSRGYTILVPGRPQLDRRYSPTQSEKRSRHRAESGPPSSIFSSVQSAVYSPRNILSKISLESSREAKAAEMQKKQPRSSRRRSTTSRPQPRKNTDRRQSTRNKANANEKSAPRHSFTSLKSRTTAPSIASRRSSIAPRAHEKKKSKGGYGLLSCFGR